MTTEEQILNTKIWEEDHSTFKYIFKEQLIQKGDQKLKRTTKTYSGPKNVYERTKWKKFGDALGQTNTTCIAPEVEFEFTYKPPKTDEDEWVANGLYIGWAKDANWPDVDIKKIMRSDRPDLVYMDLQKQKINALLAPLRESMRKLEPDTDTNKQSNLQTPLEPTRKMGLKERMALKKQQREVKDSSSNGETSLSARLNRKKEQTRQDEHKLTLFVDNIPLEYKEHDIKSHISDFDYKRVSIVKRDGYSIGKACIELATVKEAEDCLKAIDGVTWGYSIVSAQVSKPKKART